MSTRAPHGGFDRLKLLQALTPDQQRRLEPETQVLEIARGERIYQPGDPGDRVLLVKVGVVKLAVQTSEGREVILAFVGAGDVFGELAVVDDSPRDHAAEAHEDSVVYAIGRKLLVQCIRDTPEVGYQINRILGYRVKTLRSRVAELLCKSAEIRVARAIVDLADAHGIADAQGLIIPLRLSQRDLANLAGLSRETVNAVLQALRSRGVVETDRRHIRVRQPATLRSMR